MLKKFLGLTMALAFLVTAGITPVTAAEVPQMEEKSGDIKRSDLEPGWVANIYAFSKGENVTQLPPASMGSFKVEKSGYKVNDYIKSLGFPLKDKTILWQGQAYIIVEKKGYYVFMLNMTDWNNYGAVFINGTQVVLGYDQTIAGNIELEPGIHAIDFRFANRVGYYAKANAEGQTIKAAGFELRIKSPTDNTPVLAEKVLYRKK